MSYIHKTAIIEDGATIKKGAVIDAYCYVSNEAVIGNGVHLMQGAQVLNKTKIGENTKIYPYAMVGSDPQDLKYKKGEDTRLEIGENCTIREFVTINTGTVGGGGVTRVGDDVLIMNYCHIAHDCQVGNNVILANNATLAGHVELGNFSVVGGLTPIHQFVHVGDYCMIAGGSALSQDIPHFCLAEGNRATVKSLNLIGLRRQFEKQDIDELKKAFNSLFRSSEPIRENAELIMKQTDNKNVQKMCEFIINTKRGIPR